jgi:regulator of ribonuclease activity A
MSSMSIKFSTCDFCDQFRDATDDALRVIPPGLNDYGAHRVFAGPVVTVRCYDDNTLVKDLVSSPGEGRVLVVDGGGSLHRALLGGNLAAAAAKNAWAGVVVDGCVRDKAELESAAVGIRARALLPMPTARAWQGQRDVMVSLMGVHVRPGDWLYADADGIVVSAGPLH